MTHAKARSAHPAYPARTPVPDQYVPWDKDWQDYQPVEFTHKVVIANDRSKKEGGWADPEEVPADELLQRLSHHSPVRLQLGTNRPQNPEGRTGMSGRGLLGKWGPNHAADPIVTRRNPRTHKLEMVAIQRVDTGEWAIPGGMVDDGERVSATLKREFGEEAMGSQELSDHDRKELKRQLDLLFSEGELVYKGYVDDPRNTDHAWMETIAMHFHCPDAIADKLKLQAADDAKGVQWLAIEDNDQELDRLYASHSDFVRTVLDNMHKVDHNANGYDTFPADPEAKSRVSDSLIAPKPVRPSRVCCSIL